MTERFYVFKRQLKNIKERSPLRRGDVPVSTRNKDSLAASSGFGYRVKKPKININADDSVLMAA